jgi:hypothetical protein
MKIGITVRDEVVRAALGQAPEVMARHLDQGTERAAQEVARVERGLAAEHDFLGTLKQSIRAEAQAPMHHAVVTGANYARAVEEGTGPAAGRGRYFPDWTALIPYVRAHATRGGETLKKAGSRGRLFQEAGFENRAFALARSIYWHGTKPVHYARRAAEQSDGRVRQIIRAAAMAGADEVFE